MSNDLYLLHGEMYQVVGETDFTEFRDGHPFTFPALTLKNIQTDKLRAVPKYALDMLTKRVPFPLVEVDEWNKFVEYFNLATKGRFHEAVNSSNPEEQAWYQATVHKLIENYNEGFQRGNLSNESKSLLRSHAMMLLITVEMAAKEKERAAKAKPLTVDDVLRQAVESSVADATDFHIASYLKSCAGQKYSESMRIHILEEIVDSLRLKIAGMKRDLTLTAEPKE